MSDIETTTVSEDGYASTSQAGEFELSIDATGEKGPDPNQVLVADYASCYLPAFRVAADEAGYEDLGKVQIDADAELDGDDDLESISFRVYVAAEVDDDHLQDIIGRAEEVCHVHSALREGLRADIEAHGDAF
jgi:organic hydroperoxide reductase OsmC/OhrA